MSKNQKQLQFGKDGKFKIMVFGDIHEKVAVSEKTEDRMLLFKTAIETLKPDLAVFMGDIVSNWLIDENGKRADSTEDSLRLQYQRVMKDIIKHDIPLAAVFGNHDGEIGLPKEYHLKMLQEYSNCRMIKGEDISGCGNYNLLIKDSKGEKDIFNLWLIDSGNSPVEGMGKYDFVREDQIEWYERTSDELKRLNDGKPLPSILFQHVPILEEYKLFKRSCRLNPFSVEGHGKNAGKYFVVKDKKNTTGYLGQGPCTPDHNSGQFDSWKKQGDVLGAFFGHDHMNDFVGSVDGIILGQCKMSGFHIYGDGLRQGVRMITLDEKDTSKFETRMHYYRELIGKKSKSIKGYWLLNDRTHMVIETGGKVLGIAAAIVAGAGLIGGLIHYFLNR